MRRVDTSSNNSNILFLTAVDDDEGCEDDDDDLTFISVCDAWIIFSFLFLLSNPIKSYDIIQMYIYIDTGPVESASSHLNILSSL